jgi:cytosine deaminase
MNVLQGVTLPDGEVVDVSLEDGRIAAVAPAGSLAPPTARGRDAIDAASPDAIGTASPDATPPGAEKRAARPAGEVVDLRGYLLLPSLVEPHAHLDKAFTADAIVNPDGSLEGAIDAWFPARSGFQADDIAARMWAVTRQYLWHGTTAIRAHIDTGEGIGLRAIEATLAVRAALGATMDLEIVAGCSRPMTGSAGASNRAALVDALAAGADLVGGAPAIDPEPLAAVDVLAGLAANAGVGMDLHIDETLDPTMTTIDRLIDVARAGFSFPLTASHVVSLGMQPSARQASTAAAIAETGIGVVTLPQTNLYLQGRGRGSFAPRGLTAVRTLMEAGVTVAAGGDNLQDPFNPVGRADPLETAALLVVAGHLLPAEAFEAITDLGRRLLRRPPVAVMAGAPADLLAIRAPSVRGAVAGAAPDRVVWRAGRIVARTRVAAESELPATCGAITSLAGTSVAGTSLAQRHP